MVFGYTSGLMDRRNANDRLVDYSDTLLEDLLLLRNTLTNKSRPLILVCHSMGGLVARLAMTQLYTRPNEFEGLTLSHFGLLFLSTPHYGSGLGMQWPKFVEMLGNAMGARGQITEQLKAFNPFTVDAERLWNAMAKKPVMRCLCEARETYIRHFSGYVRSLSLTKRCRHILTVE